MLYLICLNNKLFEIKTWERKKGMNREQKDFWFIGGNARLVRNVNRSVILNIIRELQPISRSEIAKVSGLNKSTVSNIVGELISQDLVLEEEWRDSKIGRNPINLRLKLGKHFVGAINFDYPFSKIAISDIDGKLLSISYMQNDGFSGTEFIEKCIKELIAVKERLGIKRLRGIGVSVAGIINQKDMYVYYAPRLGWSNIEIGSIFRKYFDEDCFIAVKNDAKAAALAELWFGKYRKRLKDFVYVYIGDGIGTGIVLDRNLVDGVHYASGEFGHTTIIERGELCSCGNNGCWEAYASNKATLKYYLIKKRMPLDNSVGIAFEDIVGLAKRGDKDAREVLRRAGHYIGLGVSNILKAIDPQAIIIGGEITQVFDLIYPEIEETIYERSFLGLEKNVEILPTSLDVKPQLIGAATLAISEIFTDYKIVK